MKMSHIRKIAFFLCTTCLFIPGLLDFLRNNRAKIRKYESNKATRSLQDSSVFGDYIIVWNLDLGGKDFLLDSEFLKSGLERSVKEFINNDIKCNDESEGIGDLGSSAFFSILITEDDELNKMKRSGLGRCKGNRTRCKKKVKKTVSDAGKNSISKNVFSKGFVRDTFCEEFRDSNFFDLFNDTLITASSFSYDVDVSLINDLSGSLDLKYTVKFDETTGDGLDQITVVDLDPEEPVEFSTTCVDGACESQRKIIEEIFLELGVPFEANEHECLFKEINCNTDDLVTHIWLENYDLNKKTISDAFGELPSLTGLFLGGNQFTGTIPSNLGLMPNMRSLWLQDNALTGPIPSRLGNLRALRELNFRGNQLTGTIPTELGKLKRLRFMNLGRNRLNGSIPPELGVIEFDTEIEPEPEIECWWSFLLNFIWTPNKKAKKLLSSANQLEAIRVLSLYENQLSGSIPIELFTLNELVELSLADNKLEGEIPSELGKLQNLVVFDVHNNSFSGSMPTTIGNLRNLEILNVYNNSFEKLIPTEVGRLTTLKELTLDNNKLTGPIPTDIGNLRNLRYLSISGNNMSGEIPSELGNLLPLNNLDIRNYSVTVTGKREVSGTIPTELGNLKNWKFVVFYNNGVRGNIPSEFGGMESADILWLRNQKLSGSVPTDIANMKSLSILSFGNNNIVGTIPDDIVNLTDLEIFDAGSNAFTGDFPAIITNSSDLSYISVDDNSIIGTLPNNLGILPALQYFNISVNLLSGEVPSQYGEIESLQVLSASDNLLNGTIPPQLSNLTELQSLDLSNNSFSGGIPNDFGNFASLEVLDLSDNILGNSIPTEIGSVDTLIEINLENNEISGAIPSELGNIDSLQEIDFGGNNLNGTIPTEFAQIDSLVSVDLSENSITGEIPDLTNLTNLTSFNTSGNDVILKRFMCGLQSLVKTESDSLNCPNYCGTEDEECIGADIRSAMCQDVGCSNEGSPSCTSFCRLDYSSCSTSTDELSFQLKLQTLGRGWEIEWEIRDDADTIIDRNGQYRNFDNDINEFRCLPQSCYTFKLFPTGGDGSCCGEDDLDFGTYSLFADGIEAVATTEIFTSSISNQVGSGSCIAAPVLSTVIPEPTFSPTKSLSPSTSEPTPVTLTPTLLPSILNSSIPTFFNSSMPTVFNSSVPTIFNSSTPTVISSSVPTIFNSSVPTVLSSSFPTVSSSSAPTVGSSSVPTMTSSSAPTVSSSSVPTISSSSVPTVTSSSVPTVTSSSVPTVTSSSAPTVGSSSVPTVTNSSVPTVGSSSVPTVTSSSVPTVTSSSIPTVTSSSIPTVGSSSVPTVTSSSVPTVGSSSVPTISSSSVPTISSSSVPTASSSSVPTVISTSSTSAPTETKQFLQLTVSRLNAGDRFGTSVAVSHLDDRMVVGAINGFQEGAAYIFLTNGNFLKQLQGDSYEGPGNKYGNSIDVKNQRIVIGAPGEDDNSIINTGAIYLYDTDGTRLDKTKRVISAYCRLTQFGFSVASFGDYYVGGAPSAACEDAGKIGIHGINSNGTYSVADLDSYVSNSGDRFGTSVAATTSMMIVGSPGDSKVEILNSADNAYLYNLFGGHSFGESVAISNDVIVVGAPLFNNTGEVYIYNASDASPLSHSLSHIFSISDFEQFGFSVAAFEEFVLIGSPNRNSTGAAFLINTKLNLFLEIGVEGLQGGDEFGHSVAISGEFVLVGAPGTDGFKGTVYVLNVTECFQGL